jgi:hypothetical protein
MTSPAKIALTLLLAVTVRGPATAAEAAAPTASPGDTTAQVVSQLGEPRGIIKRGNVTTYYYERGMVDFVNGRVKTAFLTTPEEAEQQRADRERTEAAERQQAEALRQRLTEEGQRELDRQSTERSLEGKSAAERLAYWQDFAVRYPYTDVSNEVARAQAAVAAETGQQKQAAELQTIHDRVAAIQARLTQLDADYAATLTHWKRNEIKAERAKLEAERESILQRLDALPTPAPTNAVEKAE